MPPPSAAKLVPEAVSIRLKTKQAVAARVGGQTAVEVKVTVPFRLLSFSFLFVS
jgi:hypothetical protein